MQGGFNLRWLSEGPGRRHTLELIRFISSPHRRSKIFSFLPPVAPCRGALNLRWLSEGSPRGLDGATSLDQMTFLKKKIDKNNSSTNYHWHMRILLRWEPLKSLRIFIQKGYEPTENCIGKLGKACKNVRFDIVGVSVDYQTYESKNGVYGIRMQIIEI